VAELQLLVPSSSGPARGPQPPSTTTRQLNAGRRAAANSGSSRRAARAPLWQDSFQDSFFAPDNRLDGFGNSELAGLTVARPLTATVVNTSNPLPTVSEEPPSDGGGMVVEASKSFSSTRR